MKSAKIVMLVILLFASASVLMFVGDSSSSNALIALFAIMELGGTGILCSRVIRQLRRKSMPESIRSAVAGYAISHLGSLAALRFIPIDSRLSLDSAQGTFLWMELTLRVGLFVVLTSTAAVVLRGRARRSSASQIRKFTAAA